MHTQDVFAQALALPTPSIPYEFGRRLAAQRPGKFLLFTDDNDFDPEGYCRIGRCTLTVRTDFPLRLDTSFHRGNRESYDDLSAGSRTVAWNGRRLEMVELKWTDGGCGRHQRVLVADTEADARGFFEEVCGWNTEIRDEVLVFQDGCWGKSPELFQAIRNATFENLILRDGLKQDIRRDAERFFASAEQYDNYGVPWKRGVLLLGPPGNGKTHTIKALINTLGKPCLYVKSVQAGELPDSWSVRRVFDRARESAPCVLVLEDLDSLLTDKNRSFFLNELDGFAANRGIFTVATTNHPERLDPAILNRPSRFDRKFHFDLPDADLRRAFIGMWNRSLKPELRLSDAGLGRTAEQTEGFSFAYLKELFVSAVTGWMNEAGPGTMDRLIGEHVAALRSEMLTAEQARPAAAEKKPG